MGNIKKRDAKYLQKGCNVTTFLKTIHALFYKKNQEKIYFPDYYLLNVLSSASVCWIPITAKTSSYIHSCLSAVCRTSQNRWYSVCRRCSPHLRGE